MEAGYPGAANGAAADGNNGGTQAAAAPAIREQDRLMPIANVIRIMRRVLPAHAKISDDAKETIQECVSEYISFITGEANERCQREQRKTITAEDVLWAMSRLGFDDYVEPLSVYLHRYREFEGESRGVGVGVGVGAARGDHHHHHHHHVHAAGMSPMLKPRAQGSMATHHDMQMHAAMYGGAVPPPPQPPPHHHAFLMPPHHSQYAPYDMYGGEHGMAAYYGGMYAPGTGGNGGDGSGSSGSGGAGTPQTVNFDHQHPFGYK
ncbi:nuclear transcription factor Y subunit B-8-like [Oryza brachyantha]|uniref:Transcription factor CBF/NF-Y/archaeal histone domain-containing protein n=1 Tax=Oryza brachyantha TaxID=4533 RepID=J3LGM7_ORYBR|nr:nuclear transcription factor Y subunit B-8-like [Oryza brachyantha]